MPPCWAYNVSYVRLHDHSPRILLPRPTQVRREAAFDTCQVRRGSYPGFLNHYPCVLVRVGSTLGCDHVLLARVGAPRMDVTVLEHRRGIAKDEVNGARDQAVDVELAVGMDVETVLVCKYVTLVECG